MFSVRCSVFGRRRWRLERPPDGGLVAGKAALLAPAFVLLFLPTAAMAQVGDAWDWPLPPRRFGAMSQPERVQYSNAEKLFAEKNYQAAAVEFEKFMAQHPKSPVLSHCLLLRAHSLHLAMNRNTAIQLYTELLDFFSEHVDDAVPAMYLTAIARIENGNIAEGVRAMKELVENEKYLTHPLADVALNRLADHYMANKEEDKAEASWLKVLELFEQSLARPEGAMKEAKQKLTERYIQKQRFGAIDDLLAKDTDDSGKIAEAATYVLDRAEACFDRLSPDGRQSFFRWFQGKRSSFDNAGRKGYFLNRSLSLAARAGMKDDWKGLMKEALDLCRAMPVEERQGVSFWIAERLADAQRAGWSPDAEWKTFSAAVLNDTKALPASAQTAFYNGVMDRLRLPIASQSDAAILWDSLAARSAEIYKAMQGAERDQGFADLVDRLKTVGRIEKAFEIAAQISNPALAKWKGVELFEHQGKHADMAGACEEIEKMDDNALAVRALATRAGLYKDKLGRYADAITLYNQINDPPRTIWSVIECYEKLQKPAEAVNACSEIENFFEKDAPRAGLHKAEIWRNAGDSKKAIAACRSVLKKYPRHQVSSQAHQMLEKYGIATGGGVMESEE